eukprot:CAMPEP_0113448188 /NCGR_PEP_ID=MMETSP0014_2-20120614/4633_1 /TAXON_ID=2857 /ORGANISM="Nitzschia sp." /LENGTH=432 /DNA_ID=CAMNT_0000339383 /DNA_START=200 /DNA_END=1498 /DNA_ORIENTATION=+ /assembly_acc=CAM_ASM_000159
MASSSSSSSSSSVLPPFEHFIVTDQPDQKKVKKVVPAAATNGNVSGETVLPFMLSPPSQSSPATTSTSTSTSTTIMKTPGDVATFVKTFRSQIDDAVSKHGAVVFRGFPLESPQDFNTFVESFDGFQDLSYDKSMSFAVRKRFGDATSSSSSSSSSPPPTAPRICTTNEGKSGGLVFHHEQAQTPLWPSYVFFCCQLPAKPGDGGATGLVSSSQVYEKLQGKYPDFCNKCETYGVQYTVYAGPTQDTSKGAGRSWKSFFHSTTKEECEYKMKAGGWTWEWGVGPSKDSNVGPDFLKCTTPVLDCVKTIDDKKCFFNQLIATTANALEFSKVGVDGGGYDPTTDIPTQDGIDACVKFGNGDQVPLDVLLDAKRICEELAIDVQWQKGDVALISNYLMMHARRPWNGPAGTRKLLASLVAEENCTSFGKPLVAL